MVLDRIENAELYFSLHPLFPRAFEFLRENLNGGTAEGRHVINGDCLYAVAAQSPGRGRADSRLECHRKYIDIQYSIAGTDEIGWRPASECHLVEKEYDADSDCGLFADSPEVWLPLSPGTFCVLFPEDAHAPLGGEGELSKIVVKVEATHDTGG